MHVHYSGNCGPQAQVSITDDPRLPEIDQLYALLCRIVHTYGLETQPRGLKVKEVLDCSFFLENPRNRIITSTRRKVKLKYLAGEWFWYLSGERTISRILKYSKFWQNLVGPDGEVSSNYGDKIFWANGDLLDPDSQFEKVATLLAADPDSRRAIINIHTPESSSKNLKDVPCTLTLQFFIREGQLHLSVNMRSNDLVLGFCNDVFQFTMIQELMLRRLQLFRNLCALKLGGYHHHAGSMHVYEDKYDQVAAEAEGKPEHDKNMTSTMPWMPTFDSVDQMKLWLIYQIHLEASTSNSLGSYALRADQVAYAHTLYNWVI